jgi:hypothetical protein
LAASSLAWLVQTSMGRLGRPQAPLRHCTAHGRLGPTPGRQDNMARDTVTTGSRSQLGLLAVSGPLGRCVRTRPPRPRWPSVGPSQGLEPWAERTVPR